MHYATIEYQYMSVLAHCFLASDAYPEKNCESPALEGLSYFLDRIGGNNGNKVRKKDVISPYPQLFITQHWWSITIRKT